MLASPSIPLKDNLASLNRQLFSLRRSLIRKEVSLEEVGDTLPVGMCSNDPTGNRYMNQVGENIFRRDRDELRTLGTRYFSECFYPEEVVSLNQYAWGQFCRRGVNSSVDALVRIQRPDAEDQPVYQTFTLLPDAEKDYVILIIGVAARKVEISAPRLSRMIEEDELVTQHFNAFAQLTQREKEIIAYVVQGDSNPRIADQLCIARTTVETHRKNINRKLGLSSYFQLMRFAQAFDLV